MENNSTATKKSAGAFAFKCYRRKVHFLRLHLIFSCWTIYNAMHVFYLPEHCFILIIRKKESPKIFLCKVAKEKLLYGMMYFEEGIVLEETL